MGRVSRHTNVDWKKTHCFPPDPVPTYLGSVNSPLENNASLPLLVPFRPSKAPEVFRGFLSVLKYSPC